jgi:hypothetical protein
MVRAFQASAKVKEVFASKAKEKSFAQEHRCDHRSEFRKPKGLHTKVQTKRRVAQPAATMHAR